MTLATSGGADAIVAITREGRTARLLSSLRPRAPIYAATASPQVAGALALFRGVVPIVTPELDYARLERFIVSRGLVPSGSSIVYVNVSDDLGRVDANFLNLQRIG